MAVLRLSGPATPYIIMSVAGRLPEPRAATLATLKDPATGEAIDRGLALYFPAPRSFTGEDCGELHVHGGRAVRGALIQTIGALPGARLAEPGEFTRRALLNGKLDLAEVEGLSDLIEAETEWQRRQALRQMQGSLSRAAAGWRAALLEAAALVEAEIDFSDEGDVPQALSRRVAALMRPVLRSLEAELADGRRRRAHPRRHNDRYRRAAERRQIDADECARPARGRASCRRSPARRATPSRCISTLAAAPRR